MKFYITLQKGCPLDNSNYRPVSMLPLLFKVLQKLIYNQVNEFAENILNSIICGFWKAHSTQHAIFKSLKLRKKEIDKHGLVFTILINLLKVYGCISHFSYQITLVRRNLK